jgi:hypothetical protein
MDAGAIFQTFSVLLFAHLLADFPLQPERIAINKGKIPVLSVHIAIVTGAALVALGYFAPAIIITIAVTHFAIDLFKSRKGTFNLAWFLADQGAHIGVIASVSLLWPADLSHSLIYRHLAPDQLAAVLGVMMLGSGFIIAVLAGTYAIELFLKPFGDEAGDTGAGLRKGARAIGQLERLMIFVFTVIGAPAAVGLLIIAKAILVFGDIRAQGQRKYTEYAVIGALASFAWAIGISQLAVWASRYFLSG